MIRPLDNRWSVVRSVQAGESFKVHGQEYPALIGRAHINSNRSPIGGLQTSNNQTKEAKAMNANLQRKLKANPDLTREIRQQLDLYNQMMTWTEEGKTFTKKAHYQNLSAKQPHRLWTFIEARFQEFSNCRLQLGLPYLKGLEPKKSKGVARTLGPRSIVMAVVVADCIKQGLITEQTAIESKAIKPE